VSDQTSHQRGLEYGVSLQAPPGPLATRERSRLEVYFDGHEEGPGLWKWRHYFDIYDRHFRKFAGKELHLLEVGILAGGSIGLWQDYFGDGLQFYGVDIERSCRAFEAPGVHVMIGDQADPAFWESALAQLPRLDIVIDDGGHQPTQQIATLEATLPHLNPGGVYLCEDIHGSTNEFTDYVAGLSRNLNSWGTGSEPFMRTPIDFQRLVESIHLYPFVTVIERRGSPLEVLEAPKMGTKWLPLWKRRRTVMMAVEQRLPWRRSQAGRAQGPSDGT
jgi:hypothetical protein